MRRTVTVSRAASASGTSASPTSNCASSLSSLTATLACDTAVSYALARRSSSGVMTRPSASAVSCAPAANSCILRTTSGAISIVASAPPASIRPLLMPPSVSVRSRMSPPMPPSAAENRPRTDDACSLKLRSISRAARFASRSASRAALLCALAIWRAASSLARAERLNASVSSRCMCRASFAVSSPVSARRRFTRLRSMSTPMSAVSAMAQPLPSGSRAVCCARSPSAFNTGRRTSTSQAFFLPAPGTCALRM